EAVVHEISRQLRNWNVYTHQNGIITTSQGGFDFDISGRQTIRAPDIAFISKNIYRSLDRQQQWTFKGQPYFASVDLGWLVDPKNKQIYIYRRRVSGVVYRTSHGWNNVNGGSILPGFTLEVQKIDDTISQESSESSSENDEIISSHARRW
ncbi:2935_t:CDS:2, partial [Racocetra fulgida]